jgi:hypothetical protein
VNDLAGRALRALRLAGRRLSPAPRALPDFLLIGAQRAGTTSLYAQLIRHPRVLPSLRKEVQYFTLHHARGEAWYRAHFPTRRALAARRAVCGEATPYYLFHPLAPERAHRLLPEARLLVVLREPVARAWSHYQHSRARGRETLAFGAALEREAERLAAETGQPGFAHQHFSYFARGVYAEQLRRWLALYPRERLLVLRFDELEVEPDACVDRAVAFLGLPPVQLPPFPARNRREYPPLDAALRADLVRRYAPHNRDLQDLLGLPLGW